jgi:membrane protein required for colicin V production
VSATTQTMQSFNWADYTILIVILVSAFMSLIRGFARECLSLVTWIAAFIIAFKFCDLMAKLFSSFVQNDSIRVALGFALLFIAILIIGGIISHFIVHLITKTGLSGTDRTIGLIFGIIRGILIITIVLMLITVISTSHGTWYTQSYLIPHFQGLVNWLAKFLPARFFNLVHSSAQSAVAKIL